MPSLSAPLWKERPNTDVGARRTAIGPYGFGGDIASQLLVLLPTNTSIETLSASAMLTTAWMEGLGV